MWQLTSLGHASCSLGLKQFSTTEKNKTYMYFVFVFTRMLVMLRTCAIYSILQQLLQMQIDLPFYTCDLKMLS